MNEFISKYPPTSSTNFGWSRSLVVSIYNYLSCSDDINLVDLLDHWATYILRFRITAQTQYKRLIDGALESFFQNDQRIEINDILNTQNRLVHHLPIHISIAEKALKDLIQSKNFGEITKMLPIEVAPPASIVNVTFEGYGITFYAKTVLETSAKRYQAVALINFDGTTKEVTLEEFPE